MARARSFTDEDIIQAARKLHSEGKNINQTNLRLEIGAGRPSALFTAYEGLINDGVIKAEPLASELIEAAPEMEAKPLPAEVQEGLANTLEQIEKMVRFCNDKAHVLNENRVAAEIKKARLNAESADAKSEELSNQLEVQLDALAVVEEKRDELTEQLTNAKADLTDLKSELSTFKVTCERLTTENNSLKIENKQSRDTVTANKTELSLINRQLDEAKTTIAEITAAKAEVDDKLARNEQSLSDLKKQHEALQGRSEEVFISLNASTKDAQRQAEKINKLTEERATLTAENKQIAELKEQQAKNEAKLDAANDREREQANEIKELTGQLAKLTAEKSQD